MSLSNLISDALMRKTLSDRIFNIKSELKENKQFWDSIVNDDSISLDDKNHKYYPIYQETKESLESELKQIRSLT